MCGRYVSPEQAAIERQWHIGRPNQPSLLEPFPARYNVAPYKYPRAVEFVEALPRIETGKLQRFRLRTKS